MRRATGSWLSTFAKLGFKKAARRRSSARRTLGYSRRLHAEQLEDRRVLATFMVTNTQDGPVTAPNQIAGSLRQAIFDANNAPGGEDLIQITTTGTIALSAGQLDIMEGVTIDGPGMDSLTIDANGQSRIFSITNLAAGLHNVAIDDVTLAHGLASGTLLDSFGGAVFVNTDAMDDVVDNVDLELSRVRINDNSATFGGGGIAFVSQNGTDSHLTVRESIISGNHVTAAPLYGGGGILFYTRASDSTLTITESSEITNNDSNLYGGGIAAQFGGSTSVGDAHIVIQDSLIDNNKAAVDGGGIWSHGVSHSDEFLRIERTTISNNRADYGSPSSIGRGGGVFIDATSSQHHGATIEGCTIADNWAESGGGIFTETESVDIDLINDKIVGNHALDLSEFGGGAVGSGGGIYADIYGLYFEPSTFTIADSLISGNEATHDGAGVASGTHGFENVDDPYARAMVIQRSTISNNTAERGGGVFAKFLSGDSLTIVESRITGNHALTEDGFTPMPKTGVGGGIYAYPVGSQNLPENGVPRFTISASTVDNNDAQFEGGGMFVCGKSYADFAAYNITVSGNRTIDDADGSGGGIQVAKVEDRKLRALLTNVTVTNNESLVGGGIHSLDHANMLTQINNSIISGNHDPNGLNNNIGGRLDVANSQYNLVGDSPNLLSLDGTPTTTASFDSSNKITNSPGLDPVLRNNGALISGTTAAGPTVSHALLPGSDAIDRGNNDLALIPFSDPTQTLTIDQRGVTRTVNAPGEGPNTVTVDIGAYELQGAWPALVGDYNLDNSVDAADYTVWRNHLGQTVTPFTGADGNGNGKIDADDYKVWKSNFGNIAAAAALQIVTIPGDYNQDGSVDAADYTVWRNNEGAIVTPFSGADASGNGVVDQADYIIWKTNYGETTASYHDPSVVADYDRDGEVGQSDYDLWEATLGSTVDLSADGNRNGVVDMADLDVWQEYRGVTVADTVDGDYNNNGIVDVADYDLWKDTFGSTTNLAADGNDDGVVDVADYTIWRDNLGKTTAAIWPTILGGGSGVPFEVPDMAPQVVGFSLSGSNSAHPAFDFDSVVGSGEQLRSVPVGGLDSITITFSEEVFVLNSDLTLTNLEGTTLPAIDTFEYDLDSHAATWQFASVLPVGRYLVQLSDSVIDLDQDALDGEFTNPWSLAEAAGYASTFPSGDGTAGGEFRFRFTNLAADYNGNNIVESGDFSVWNSNYNQSGKTSTRQGDGDGNGTTEYPNDLTLYQAQLGKNYTAWPSIEPGVIMVSTLVDENDGNYSYGDLSLREAMALAGATSSDETIAFAPGLTGTMYLNSILSIGSTFQGNLTIEGPGVDQLTLDATSSSSGTFQVTYNSPINEFTLRDMRLTGSVFAVNASGSDVDVVLQRMDISENWGTAVYMYGGGDLTILDSEIADNQASNIIEFWGGSTGHLTIGNTSILDNYGVGTFIYGGSADIFNTTYSGNYISDPSGGIWIDGAEVTVTNSTITDNEGEGGGGIYISYGGNVTLHNSIVVGNRVFGSANDIYSPGYQAGTFDSSSSNNLIGVDATSIPTFPSGSNDNQVGVTTNDLKLAPLGYYGGPTRTHMLLEDSVAIDAGINSRAVDGAGDILVYDQRGLSRVTGAAVDVGAVEATSGSLLTVGTLTDENDSDHSPADFSLREAMDLASDLYGVETIQFDPALSGTLTLSLGQLTIDTDLEIVGPGADQLAISGNNQSRVFSVNSGVTATLSALRITGGNASYANGAGVYTSGTLVVDRSQIDTNSGAGAGTGIYVAGGTLTLANSTVSNNTGAYVGGGIYIGSTSSPTLIINSTISSNTAYYVGGGIYDTSSGAVIVNSTITANTSSYSLGGGIAGNSGTKLFNSIVAGNFGASSSANDLYGTFNSTSAYNLIGYDSNLSNGINNGSNQNQVGGESGAPAIDPHLSALGYYGGTTKTHRLLSSSTAIDAGDNAVALSYLLDEDQRGGDRIVDWLGDDLEATVDIGAVELAVDEIFS